MGSTDVMSTPSRAKPCSSWKGESSPPTPSIVRKPDHEVEVVDTGHDIDVGRQVE